MKIITADDDFERCIDIQVAGASGELSKESWEGFYRKSMDQYKEMIDQGLGHWFAAVMDDCIVGSLGIFIEGDVARFQIVSTHPDQQRMGVCSSLVYKSAEYILKNTQVKTLVMVASDDYHAAQIYESVGFKPTEKQIGVCWFDKERHS